MSRPRALRRPALLLSLAVLSGALALPASASASGEQPSVTTASLAPVSSLVRVSTPTRGHKDRLLALDLDLTEHATEQYVEVVLHGAADANALREAGLDFVVEVVDLQAQNRENRELDAAYAASVASSPLPSGRTSYRTLAEYDAEMAQLAADNPTLVKPLTLPEPTIEGRPVNGIEITRDVTAHDGKPVFLLMGLHHAREWPSGEHALEFAYDLVNGSRAGDPRTVDLLSRARVIVVPVVNPDGFNASITSGLVDLRETEDETITIIGTPGNAYKRKNCRPADGVDSIPKDSCHSQPSQGGFGTGVDLNRNYGGLWGGAGAAATPEDPTYRGAAPFSEPETRNVRALVASRQVTTLITNHTFSNLVLRPPGVRAQGPPPDETVYEALGARMAAQNGYVNQPSYALYDTTGTTEDWTYYATGGLGFTFEIGEEFHPPYERVVEHYVGGTQDEDRGAGPFVDKGNREAYYQALMSAADSSLHSVLTGSAPAGAELTLEKSFITETSEVVAPVTGTPGERQDFEDTLRSSMTVGPDGTFTWHTNPSTRPAVMSQRLEELGEPLQSESFEGGPTPPGVGSTDHLVTVTDPNAAVMQVDLTWPTPDDMDLEVYRKQGEELTLVASSGAFVNTKESAFVEDVTPGEYVLRQINFASASPTYTMTAKVYDEPEIVVTEGKTEAYSLVCRIDALEKRRQDVVVDRGEQVTVSDPCGVSGTVDPTPVARDILRACPDDRVPTGSRGDIAGNTHERAIDCMVWYEIAEGYDSERYGPEAPVKRGQMASFVARMVERSGGSFPADRPDAFGDDEGSTHEASIDKLASVGIVKGKAGRYDADAVVTRDQMAAFLVRAYEYRSGRSLAPRGDYFDDDSGNAHEAAINKSAEAGFTGGRNGAYQPGAPVMRDQMASFLARVLDLHVTQGTTQPKQ